MKFCKTLLFIFFSISLQAQENSSITLNDFKNKANFQFFEIDISTFGQVSTEDRNPFWFYANRHGLFDRETSFAGLAGTRYERKINSNNSVSARAAISYKNGLNTTFFINELYATYSYKMLMFEAGIKQRETKYDNLSSVGGDILWSGNARAIPGVNFVVKEPIKLLSWLGVRGNFAHYQFFDDRVVDHPKVHHKSLFFDFKISKNQSISAGLVHYVQWGGTSPEYGDQDISFKDFAKVVFGVSGGNTENDQINALGNHIGSYRLKYQLEKEAYALEVYYQSIFEDRSGRELNNFPDGVWGLFFKPKKISFISSILYEYLQTVSQSGRPRPLEEVNQNSGGDNYFNNTVYTSGWTYFGQTIGAPFMTPSDTNIGIINNRSIVHHLGVSGSFWKLNYELKGTYEERFGNYSAPLIPTEKAFYSLAHVTYPSKFGNFSTQIGIDYSSYTSETFGIGIGYSYSFEREIKKKR
jgi:hypothetical protein